MNKSLIKKIIPFVFGALGALIGIATTFLVAKPLGSDVYGKVQYYVSVITTLSLILSFGLPTFLIKKNSGDSNQSSFSSTILVFNIISVIVLIPYGLLAYFVLSFEKDIWMILACFAGAYFVGYSLIVSSEYLSHKKLSLYQILSSLLPKLLLFVTAIILLYLVDNKYFVFLYVIGYIATYAIVSIPFSIKHLRFKGFTIKKDDWKLIASFFAISLLTTVCSYLTKILQGEFYSDYAVLGTMSLSTSILTAGTLFCSIISRLSQPYFASLKPDDKQGQLALFRKVLRLNSNISIPFCIAFCFEAYQLLSFIGGDSYASCYPVLIILAVASLVEVLVGPVNVFLSMTGKEKILVINSIINLVLLTGLSFGFSFIFKYGASLAFLISAIVVSLVSVIEISIIYKTLSIDFKTIVSILVKTIISAGLFSALSFIKSTIYWIAANGVFGLALIGLFFLVTPFKQDRVINTKLIFSKIKSFFIKVVNAIKQPPKVLRNIFNVFYLIGLLYLVFDVIFFGSGQYAFSFSFFGISISQRMIAAAYLIVMSFFSMFLINKSYRVLKNYLICFMFIALLSSLYSFIYGVMANSFSNAFLDLKTFIFMFVMIPIVDLFYNKIAKKKFFTIYIISLVTLSTLLILGVLIYTNYKGYASSVAREKLIIARFFDIWYGNGTGFIKVVIYHPSLMISAVVFPIVLNYVLTSKWKNWYLKLIYSGVGIVLLAGILQSWTRSLILWTAIGTVIVVIIDIYSYFKARKEKKGKIIGWEFFVILGLAAAMLGIGVFAAIKTGIIAKIFTKHNGDATRIGYLTEALQTMLKLPLIFGKGYGYVIESAGTWHIETSLLEVLLKQGIIGFVIWLMPIILVFFDSPFKSFESAFKAILAIIGLYFLSLFNPYLCNVFGFMIITFAFSLFGKDYVEVSNLRALFAKPKQKTEIYLMITGGLGNQLFEYAFARNINLSIPDSKLYIDTAQLEKYKLRNYELDHFSIPTNVTVKSGVIRGFNKLHFIFLKTLHRIEYKLTRKRKEGYKYFSDDLINLSLSMGGIMCFDTCYHKIDINKIATKKKIFVYGYFQSIDYFKEHEEEIIKECTPIIDNPDVFKFCNENIIKNNTGCFSFRCSELKNLGLFIEDLEPGYLKKATDYMRKANPKTVLLFTEDPNGAKNYLEDFSKYVPAYNFKPHEQIYIMSKCKYFAVSNSSFSWWGSYLSKYKYKKICAPSVWYKGVNTKDIALNYDKIDIL